MKARHVLWLAGVMFVLGLLLGCGPSLPLAKGHLETLNKVAGSYPNEIGACLAPDSLEIPYTRRATRDVLSPAPCEDGARVWWHAHPEELLFEPTASYRNYVREYVPEDFAADDATRLCYLSGRDVQAVIEASYQLDSLAYAIVGVKPGVYCWWSVQQIRDAGLGTQFLPPPDGQVSW